MLPSWFWDDVSFTLFLYLRICSLFPPIFSFLRFSLPSHPPLSLPSLILLYQVVFPRLTSNTQKHIKIWYFAVCLSLSSFLFLLFTYLFFLFVFLVNFLICYFVEYTRGILCNFRHEFSPATRLVFPVSC